MTNKRIKEIFIKLKKGHDLWKVNGEEYRGRLLKAFDPFFVELESLGVSRNFSESLLFFGEEFVVSVKRENAAKKKLKLSEDLSDDELEKIWGARPDEVTKKDIREAKLAEKYGAKTWVSLPMKGDKVGIRVLTYKEK